MRIGKDGFLQLYYSRENACNDQDSIQRISHDGGASWGEVIAFSGHGIVARDGMLGLAEFGNELVAVFETNEEGPMHIKSVTSPGTIPPLFDDIYAFILTIYRRRQNLAQASTRISSSKRSCRSSSNRKLRWSPDRHVPNRRRWRQNMHEMCDWKSWKLGWQDASRSWRKSLGWYHDSGWFECSRDVRQWRMQDSEN